jgi:hypothetical protein
VARFVAGGNRVGLRLRFGAFSRQGALAERISKACNLQGRAYDRFIGAKVNLVPLINRKNNVMKKSTMIVYLMMALSGVLVVGQPAPARAADNDGAERLDRLEQRVNQMAERQEQLMKRLQAQMDQRAPGGPPDAQNGPPQFRPPLRSQMAPAGAPLAAAHPQIERAAKSIQDWLGLLFLIGMICNILLAIWIFTDIRKRGEGSGIFIALALVAGIPAAIIYSLTRIGDRKV